jgi:hypothetical protein
MNSYPNEQSVLVLDNARIHHDEDRTPKYKYGGKVTFEFFTNSSTQGFFI